MDRLNEVLKGWLQLGSWPKDWVAVSKDESWEMTLRKEGRLFVLELGYCNAGKKHPVPARTFVSPDIQDLRNAAIGFVEFANKQAAKPTPPPNDGSPQIGEFWRHFKGTVYEIVAFTTLEESGEDAAIYRAVGETKTWARALSKFSEFVARDSYRGPRFWKVAAPDNELPTPKIDPFDLPKPTSV